MKKLLTSLLMGWLFLGILHAQYCLPTYSSACTSNDFINGVLFGSINNQSTGCANPGVNNYSDYTTMSTSVLPSNSYSITLTPGTVWSQGFAVWIDFNQNFSFADPGELVFQSVSATTTPQTGIVNIPPGAFPGTTRMRVLCRFATVPTATDFCIPNASFGECEDYSVMVGAPSPDDLGASAIVGLSSGCGFTANTPIIVNITNYGTNPQVNPDVSYSVNGGTVVTETTSLTIAPGATVSYVFATTADLSLPGFYTIDAWTSLPGDGFILNDSTSLTVQSIPTITSYPYLEEFDTNNGGWSSGGTNNSWQWGAPAASTINSPYSSPNVWTTNLTGNNNSSEQSYVISPCYDMSSLGAPVIEVAIWWNSENSWDGAVLQSTIDNGATWQNVGAYLDPVNWYNIQNQITSPGAPFNPNDEAWNGTSGPGWVIAKHDLTGLGGQPGVRLRFAFSSDLSVNYNGFAFDNVFIYDKPDYDLGIVALGANTPTSICSGGSVPLEVVIENFGAQAQSNIQVVAEVTGAGTSTFSGTYTNTIAVASTATLNLGNLNVNTPGMYYIKSYTSSPLDSLAFNDTSYFAISVSPTPLDPITNNPVTCFPDSLLITATGNFPGVDYFWYDAAAGGNLLAVNDSFVTPYLTSTATYYVIGKSKVQFNVGAESKVIGSGFSTTFATGNGLTFDVLNPDGITIDSFLIYPNTNGLLSIIISNSAGTVIAAANLPVPTPAFAGAPTRIPVGISIPAGTGYEVSCSGAVPGNIFYNTGGATYPYIDAGNNVMITNTINGLGTAIGYYYFFYDWDISAYSCQSNMVPVTALVGVAPPVNLGPDAIICGSYLVNGTTPTAVSYSWSTGQTSPNITITNSGIYSIVAADINGCIETDSINVNILPSPVVNLGPDVNGCAKTLVLDAGTQGQGATYLWSSSANYANTQTVTVSNSGTYIVTVVSPAGCTDTDTINVALNGVDVDLGADIVSCASSVLLNAGNVGANYSWSTGALTQTINVTTPGNYTVIVTKNGCVDVDVINVSFGTAPTVDLGPDITACDIATLNAGNSGSYYSWSNGASSQVINVTQTGTYNVYVSIGNGCGTTDQVNVTIYESPDAHFTYTNTQPAVYNFNSLSTTGSLPFTYSWNFGDGTTSNLQNPQHTYTVGASYQVTLVVTHATCGSSTHQIELLSATGIEDGTLSGDVSIYPNPNNGIFTISSDNLVAETFSIEVADVQGRNVYTNVLNDVNGFSQEINLTSLAKGVYVVKLSDGTRSGFTRVIIE